MEHQEFDLVEMVPDFPEKPAKEISRDPLIRWITEQFGPSCQKQMIACGPQTGKTNFMAQFALFHRNRVISYFINSNPMTQELKTYLYVICNQMYRLLGKPNLTERIGLEQLKSTFTGLAMNLTEQAKIRGEKYYIAIDGLEHGLHGDQGTRIVDFLLTSFTNSPYILYSCRLDQKDSIPFQGITIKDEISPFLEFNLNDTHDYLSGLKLKEEEIKEIHQKAKGLPGYIKIIRDTIQTSGIDWIRTNALPDSLETLIKDQLHTISMNFPHKITETVEIIAVSPKPMQSGDLAELVEIGAQELVASLNKTGIVSYDNDTCLIQLSAEFSREVILANIGSRKEQITTRLLQYFQGKEDRDELQVTLLMRDINDFNGILSLLDTAKVISTWSKTKDVNLIADQFRIGTRMAYDLKRIDGLIKLSLGWISSKCLLSNALDSNEISALIAIGDSQDALQQIYSLTEPISKIRLLSRAYTSMSERGEKVPKGALEELSLLVASQSLKEEDKEIAQDLAIDLFPLLPDKAIEILESTFTENDKQNVIEAAINARATSQEEKLIREEFAKVANPRFGYFGRFYSKWLKQQTIDMLGATIQTLKNTKAKEYLIRQWCIQNKANDQLQLGIQLWIDTVIADSSFSIPIRSLRQLSNSLKYVDEEQQEKLVRRLEIPAFSSLRTPWEEWVGFYLNLAEVIYSHNKSAAQERIDSVYETINLEINDLDVKIFCYARLWVTVSKHYLEIADSVKQNFERVLSSLLKDAALHDEILSKSLQIIAPIDLDYAIEKALEMNTQNRRLSAIRSILMASLRKNPTKNISGILENVSHYYDDCQRAYLLVDLTYETWRRNVVLGDENQAMLLKLSRKIFDPLLRAESLFNLAAIWTNEKLIKVKNLITEAKSSWDKEDDLRAKIAVGYDHVARIASKCNESARNLCKEVQNLKLLPGSALAVGELGLTYVNTLDILIESISLYDLTGCETLLDNLQNLINMIPSRLVRIKLHGQLAARSYTVGYPKAAEEIIRIKIIPEIEKLDCPYDRSLAILFCLPVIYKYHKQQAQDLAKDMPESLKEKAWLLTTVWLMANGSLTDALDVEHLKVKCDYPTLKDYAIEAARNLSRDSNLFSAILAICKTVEQSIHASMLDIVKAFDLLNTLDNLAKERLPDSNNIKHDGYLIAAKSIIHGARSVVYKVVSRKQGLSKVDIRKDWASISMAARGIPNLADKVFVMNVVAEEYYKYDNEKAFSILQETEDLIEGIPALVDRSDRLEQVGRSWGKMGKKDFARFTFDKAVKLVEQMNDYSQEKKLELLVQVAYEFNPELADELTMKYDSRFPEKILNPVLLSNKANKLVTDPERLQKADADIAAYTDLILGYSSRKLYSDLVYGHGCIPSQSTLLEWLFRASHCDEDTFFSTLRWIQECISRQSKTSSLSELSNVFLDLGTLILKFATLISPARKEGMPEDVLNILPGLSSKVTVFKTGEVEKARKFVKEWLKKHAEGYLKIVDPYFGADQIVFLADLPKTCKILIVTTNVYFKDFVTQEDISSNLSHVWSQYGKGTILPISMIIVPKEHEELFHDRVIITKNGGLEIGQSLNGLGEKTGKIIDLPYDDAKELELKYVDDMLNQNTWFMNYDIRPMIVTLGS